MFFTISEGNITTLTGYIAGLVGDALPLILLVLGVSVGMYIFRQITK